MAEGYLQKSGSQEVDFIDLRIPNTYRIWMQCNMDMNVDTYGCGIVEYGYLRNMDTLGGAGTTLKLGGKSLPGSKATPTQN